MESGISRDQTLSLLVKSPHRDLTAYLEVGKPSAKQDGDFFAHLIAWNARKGQIRDSKVALPLIAINQEVPHGRSTFRENALAHLAQLSPRMLLQAYDFSMKNGLNGRRRAIPALIKEYLRAIESNGKRWESTVVQHRASMRSLYTRAHVKPAGFADDILFKGFYKPGSVFAVIENLKHMAPLEAAGEIISRRIPFLIASASVGKKLKDKDVLVAIIKGMSPGEITTHMKMLEKLGVKKDPALRGALDQALGRVASGNSSSLKLSRAADSVQDPSLKAALMATQEKKLDRGMVDGNWAVLADKSSSMSASIELAKQIAAMLARAAGGDVHLVFFNESPTYYKVTGMTLEEINNLTQHVVAHGATAIGLAMDYIRQKNVLVDGVVVVSDGGENRAPAFGQAYLEYAKQIGKTIPIYLYHVPGDPNNFAGNCGIAGVSFTQFDINSQADYYSIPNLVTTMRSNRYSLIDEIMDTPLLTVEGVLDRKPIRSETYA